MEEAAKIGNYLPLSFKSPKEQEYIAFLWGTFDTGGRRTALTENSSSLFSPTTCSP